MKSTVECDEKRKEFINRIRVKGQPNVLRIDQYTRTMLSRYLGVAEIPMDMAGDGSYNVHWDIKISPDSSKLLLQLWDKRIQPRLDGYFDDCVARPITEARCPACDGYVVLPAKKITDDGEVTYAGNPAFYHEEVWDTMRDLGITIRRLQQFKPSITEYNRNDGLTHHEILAICRDGKMQILTRETSGEVDVPDGTILLLHSYANSNTQKENTTVHINNNQLLLDYAPQIKGWLNKYRVTLGKFKNKVSPNNWRRRRN